MMPRRWVLVLLSSLVTTVPAFGGSLRASRHPNSDVIRALRQKSGWSEYNEAEVPVAEDVEQQQPAAPNAAFSATPVVVQSSGDENPSAFVGKLEKLRNLLAASNSQDSEDADAGEEDREEDGDDEDADDQEANSSESEDDESEGTEDSDNDDTTTDQDQPGMSWQE